MNIVLFKKKIEEIRNIKGVGTQLISVIIPSSKKVYDVRA